MLDLSLDAANLWFGVSNTALIIGSVLVLGGTIGAIWTASIRDRYSDERIAKNEAETATANERSLTLGVELEKQRERAANAERDLLEVKRKIAPRSIKGERFLKLLEGKPKAPVEIWFLKEDAEAWKLALEIRDFLKVANWGQFEPVPIPPTTVERYANTPSAYGAASSASGVSLVVRLTPRQYTDPVPPNPPLEVLGAALIDSLGQLGGWENAENAPAAGVIRIVVGPKPAGP